MKKGINLFFKKSCIALIVVFHSTVAMASGMSLLSSQSTLASFVNPRQTEEDRQIEAWSHFWQEGHPHSFEKNPDWEQSITEHWEDFFEGLLYDARVLDIGTGNLFVPRIAKEVSSEFDIHAIDRAKINPEPSAKEGVSVYEGDILDLPFEDDYFDAVTSNFALEFINLSLAFPELHRVLREGGEVSFVMLGSYTQLDKIFQTKLQLVNLILSSNLLDLTEAYLSSQSQTIKEGLRREFERVKLFSARKDLFNSELESIFFQKIELLIDGRLPPEGQEQLDSIREDLETMLIRLKQTANAKMKTLNSFALGFLLKRYGFHLEDFSELVSGEDFIALKVKVKKVSLPENDLPHEPLVFPGELPADHWNIPTESPTVMDLYRHLFRMNTAINLVFGRTFSHESNLATEFIMNTYSGEPEYDKVLNELSLLMESLLDLYQLSLDRGNSEDEILEFVDWILGGVNEVLSEMRRLDFHLATTLPEAHDWFSFVLMPHILDESGTVFLNRVRALAAYSLEGSVSFLYLLGMHVRSFTSDPIDFMAISILLGRVLPEAKNNFAYAKVVKSSLLFRFPTFHQYGTQSRKLGGMKLSFSGDPLNDYQLIYDFILDGIPGIEDPWAIIKELGILFPEIDSEIDTHLIFANNEMAFVVIGYLMRSGLTLRDLVMNAPIAQVFLNVYYLEPAGHNFEELLFFALSLMASRESARLEENINYLKSA